MEWFHSSSAWSPTFLLTLFVTCLFLVNRPAEGQAVMPQEITPFHEIRADHDGDGQVDLLGDTVTVTGLANINSGMLHEIYLQIFIQNESAGISLFDATITEPVSRGDSIVATGVVQQYYGMTEIKVTDYKVHSSARPLPEPIPLARALQNLPAYEGMLVKGSGTITDKGTRFNGKFINVSPADSVSNSIRVYVSNFHRQYQEFDFESLSSGDRVQLTGVVSYYNPDKAKVKGYKVFLRTPDDLTTIGFTQNAITLVGIGVLLIFIICGGWIYTLRSRVQSKTQKLQQSLEDKNMLLKEIHHRVKNNLAIITGLIELQMDGSLSGDAQRVLRDSQSRIRSMALVHDKLYRTTTVTDIGMQTYIEELVESLKSTFAGRDADIQLHFDIDEIHLDIDQAIPCGLLINELVVNAFKHAFADQNGRLEIQFKDLGESYKLVIADNGRGLPNDFRDKMQSSLGLMLVETFRDQLGAEMEIENQNGACFSFEFPANQEQDFSYKKN